MLHLRRATQTTRIAALFLAAAFFCPSCSEKEPTRSGNPDSGQWTDAQILALVYSSYEYPSGFYHEDYQGGTPYYENTVSVRRDSSWIELCTTDHDLAAAWSESSALNMTYYRTLVSERETEKYFEFRRVWLAHPNDILLSRVHKCNYLDRSTCDRLQHPAFLGVFNERPVSPTAVKELIEYMWFSGLTADMGGKVLSSQTTQSRGSFTQTILYATLVGGDWGMCDLIYLQEARFNVLADSGTITEETETLRTITGRCH